MVSTEIRERRRALRYRNLLVRQAVQLKNRISCVLMQASVTYKQEKLHNTGYLKELLTTNPDMDESLRRLLHQCRERWSVCGRRKVRWFDPLSEIPSWRNAWND